MTSPTQHDDCIEEPADATTITAADQAQMFTHMALRPCYESNALARGIATGNAAPWLWRAALCSAYSMRTAIRSAEYVYSSAAWQVGKVPQLVRARALTWCCGDCWPMRARAMARRHCAASP